MVASGPSQLVNENKGVHQDGILKVKDNFSRSLLDTPGVASDNAKKVTFSP